MHGNLRKTLRCSLALLLCLSAGGCSVGANAEDIVGKTAVSVFNEGFHKMRDGTRYFDSNGMIVRGFNEIGGKKYLFDETGLLVTGWKKLDGKKYYFDSDGAMQTGWQTHGKNKYYFGDDGNVRTGVQKIDGEDYYFDSSGVMHKGYWEESDGNRYYVEADGHRFSGGEIAIDGEYYYFGEDGAMQTGWQKIGDDYSLFDREDGTRLSDCMVEGITIGKDGRAKTGSWSESKIKTLMKAHEVMLEQTEPTDSMEEKKLKCFKWVMSFPYHRFRIVGDVCEDNSWAMTFANDIFDDGMGCCVSEAAAAAFLFREIGYEGITICHDSGHAWACIGEKIYDPLFAEAKDFDMNYNAEPYDYRDNSVNPWNVD